MANRRKKKQIWPYILLFAAVAVTAYFVAMTVDIPGLFSGGKEDPAASAAPTAAPLPTPEPIKTSYAEKELSAVHEGELILVSNDHLYVFPEEDPLSSVYELKSKNYQVRDMHVRLRREAALQLTALMDAFAGETGIRDIIITSGFRSLETQTALYQKKVDKIGEEQAALWVAYPGGSEHHTGYTFDMGIYRKGLMYDFDGTGEYAYVLEHAAEYGFILRYPHNKKDITGIDYEPWHMRYVGRVHAEYIAGHDLCFEEYLDLIRKYTYDGEHLKTVSEGQNYEIYYVSAPAEGTARIPVPEGSEYSISGDNVGGFVVTVKTGK